MNWKHIKTFLIFLFLAINVYLIYTTPSFLTKNDESAPVNDGTMSEIIDIVKKNYGVTLKKESVSNNISPLNNINTTNIVYTDPFKKIPWKSVVENGVFSISVKTDTFSYNENAAEKDIRNFLQALEIEEECYELEFSKADEGLVCVVSEKIDGYTVFNGSIRAVFSASQMNVTGKWHVPEKNNEIKNDSDVMVTPIYGLIIDTAEKMNTESTGKEIKKISYGYYISSYDENTVSKSATAIACYVMETDAGYKYYYDAINGKSLKQEE